MAGLKNVLIIEDEAMIRDLYRTVLVRDGRSVQVAADSKEAFKILQKFHPDVVLLDIILPGLSGLSILKELRDNAEYGCQKAIILLLTDLTQHDLDNTAFENRADGYIIKADILPPDLCKVIHALE